MNRVRKKVRDFGFRILDFRLNASAADLRNPKSEIRNPKWLVLLFLTFLPSCTTNSATPTTRPASAYDRQQAALKDPFGYSPNNEKTDISGGGIRNFDKEAFKKDVDHVLNP